MRSARHRVVGLNHKRLAVIASVTMTGTDPLSAASSYSFNAYPTNISGTPIYSS